MAKKAQRNLADEPEMSQAANKKNKAKVSTEAKANANANIGMVPEGSLITAPSPTALPEEPPAPMEMQEKASSLKFCAVCDNYLYMQVDAESQELTRLCRKCGYKEQDTTGGLVMEMMIQEDSAEGYKVLLNEFTRKDPRLPHIRKNITCPNLVCDSNKGGKEPDVIYIKYDLVNMMYLYICDICGEKWHTRSRS